MAPLAEDELLTWLGGCDKALPSVPASPSSSSGISGLPPLGAAAAAWLADAGLRLSPRVDEAAEAAARLRAQAAAHAAGGRGCGGLAAAEAEEEDDAVQGTMLCQAACGRVWRCLKTTHAPGCARCTPPPPAEESANWELSRGKASTSGEKKLRAQLARVPEWTVDAARLGTANVLAARAAAAAAQQPHGGVAATAGALAAALRGRDTTGLRKAHLLALCAEWGYRSDTWTRKAPKRAAPAAPQQQQQPRRRAAALAAVPTPPLRRAPDAAAGESLRLALATHVAAYAASLSDARVHAAAAAEPRAPVTNWSVPMYDALLPTLHAFAAATSSDATALATRAAAAARADAEPDAIVGTAAAPPRSAFAPWWMSDAAALLARADAHLLFAQGLVAAHGSGHRTMDAATAGQVLSAPDAAIAASWVCSISQLGVLLSVCQSALASARLSGQYGEAGHTRVAAEVAAALAAALAHSVATHEGRRAWSVTRQQQQLPPPPPPPRAGLPAPEALRCGDGGTAFWPAFCDSLSRAALPAARCVRPAVATHLAAGLRAMGVPAPDDPVADLMHVE